MKTVSSLERTSERPQPPRLPQLRREASGGAAADGGARADERRETAKETTGGCGESCEGQA